MRKVGAWLIITAVVSAVAVDAEVLTPKQRAELIARAAVWRDIPTDQLDLFRGPQGEGAFPPGALVRCDYQERDFDGKSPKFMCQLAPGDLVKVKYGARNGEVHGEVAASRLLWALGFLADRMYPVRILCRGCPGTIGVATGEAGVRYVHPAVIERPLAADDLPDRIAGWSWAELPTGPDAPHDALRLLAAFLQHTDTKPEQQRLVCLNGSIATGTCTAPFLMINDLGLTFGRASFSNENRVSSADLDGWRNTPIWKYQVGCVANLRKSFSGTLRDPVIGEEGRRFLAQLLSRLEQRQLHDLFRAAGMEPQSWTDVFNAKRQAVMDRQCSVSWTTTAPPLFGTGVLQTLQRQASPSLTATMNAVSILGYTRLMIAVALILAFAVNLRAGAALLLLLALAGALTDSAKAVAGMPRPDAVDPAVHSLVDLPVIADAPDERSVVPSVDDDDVYGFPSGHVAAVTAFMLGLVWLFGWRRAWLGAAILIPVMALSRLYLGRHFPADVIGGIAVGVVATGIVVRLRLWRLDEPRRGGRTALRVAALGAAAIILSLASGVPEAYEAGRLAGIALSVAMLATTYGLQQPVASPVRRIALAALMFGAAWWPLSKLMVALELTGSQAGDMLVAGLPAFLLLPGPLVVDRWFARQAARRTSFIVRRRIASTASSGLDRGRTTEAKDPLM